LSAETEFMEKLANLQLPSRGAQEVPVALLGRQAARRFLAGEEPNLTNAVAGIATEARLGPNHIRRVAESANQAAWSETFRGGDQRHVQFAPADPEVVLGALDTAPEDMGMPVFDYAFEPAGSVLSPPDDPYAVFGMEAPPEPEKVASGKVTWRDLAKIEGTADRARTDADRLAMAMVQTGEELYGMVKQAYRQEGRGLLQIGAAITGACESEDFGKMLTRQLAQRLERDGLVVYSHTTEVEKLAEVLVVDPSHPLLAAARSLEAMSTLHYSRTAVMDEARTAHREALRTYVQSAR
jgi:hypothetical protein